MWILKCGLFGGVLGLDGVISGTKNKYSREKEKKWKRGGKKDEKDSEIQEPQRLAQRCLSSN